MGRPRFRLEDVKIDDGGDSRIFGSLRIGNENDDCGDGDRTFRKVFKKINKILCGCEDYCGCESNYRLDNNPYQSCSSFCGCEDYHPCECDGYESRGGWPPGCGCNYNPACGGDCRCEYDRTQWCDYD